MKFHDKLNDHWLWWYSINDVYGNVPGFNCWLIIQTVNYDGGYCEFNATGIYKGIGGAESHVDTY